MVDSYTQVFGGQNIFPSQLTLLVLALTTDATLEWPTEQAMPDANVVADIMEVTPDAGGHSIILPDATLAGPGQSVLVNNVGAFTFSVKDAGGNTVGAVPSGEVWQFYLSDNTTTNGVWTTFQFGTGTSSATAAALAGAGLKAIVNTLNQKHTPRSSAASPLAIVDGDRAAIVQWTGGVGAGTLPDPATVGTDWFTMVRNNGTGTWTITPAAGTINGQPTIALSAFSSAIIYTDGANYFTIGLSQVTPTNFDFTSINVAGTGTKVLAGTELNRIAYKLTGVLVGARIIEVPASVQQYWVDNATSGAFALTVKTNAGAGVVVPQGCSMLLYCDGTDVVAAEGAPTTGAIPVGLAGTGLTSYTQGDLLYSTGTDVLGKLPKSATATRYLANTGASNAPNWDLINLANGVTGRLPLANIVQGSALSVLGVAGAVVADEAPIVSVAANQVLRNNPFGTGIGWGPIRLDDNTNAVTNVLDETNGGTGITTYTQGDMLYASAANTLAKLGKDATGLMALFNTGASNNPAWMRPRFSVTAAANAAIQFALSDSWNWIPHTEAATPRVWTIPANATIPFDIGVMIGIDNRSGSGPISVTPAGGVTLDGHGTSGTVIIAAGYKGILVKMDTNTWMIMTDTPIASGVGTQYAGWAQAGAASQKVNAAATGWVATHPALGHILWTHNLGLSSANDMSVVPGLLGTAGDDRTIIVQLGVNGFDIFTADVGSGAVDVDTTFLALRMA
jgi:hypothetical protein